MKYGKGRTPIQVVFCEDHIEINGKSYYPQSPGQKKTDYYFEGIYYDTVEELWVAKMLYWMKIPFLHHVLFSFPAVNQTEDGEEKEEELIWCPDFIFAYPLRWVGKICNGSVIIGLEVKRKRTNGTPRRKSRWLLATRGIPVLIISRRNIIPYKKSLELPLIPLSKNNSAVA